MKDVNDSLPEQRCTHSPWELERFGDSIRHILTFPLLKWIILMRTLTHTTSHNVDIYTVTTYMFSALLLTQQGPHNPHPHDLSTHGLTNLWSRRPGPTHLKLVALCDIYHNLGESSQSVKLFILGLLIFTQFVLLVTVYAWGDPFQVKRKHV
jgi:hypothetical protein